jgi:hypothetical protein
MRARWPRATAAFASPSTTGCTIEVTPMMFEFMERVFEPPDAAELTGAFVLDTGAVTTP